MPKPSVLIVEDDEAIGLNLAAAVEDGGASVIGPFGSVSEALVRLDTVGIDGAVLDVRLKDRDVTPVALRLIEKEVPFVIHSGHDLPSGMAGIRPEPEMVRKPADPETVVNRVLDMVGRSKPSDDPRAAALALMQSAQALLDEADEALAAAHLQTAIDVLADD